MKVILKLFSIPLTKKSVFYIVMLLVFLALLGALRMVGAWTETVDQALEKSILSAKIGATFMNGEMLQHLFESKEGIGTSEYYGTKKKLVMLASMMPGVHHVFIYTEQDNRLYLMADSRPDAIAPPGQMTPDKNNEYRKPFGQGVSILSTPATDGQGTLVQVLVPMVDDHTGETIAVFGIAYLQSRWLRSAAIEAAQVGAVTLMVFAVLFAFYRIIRQQSGEALRHEMEKTDLLKQEINRKDGFFLTVSHEFKTPLTIINTALQMMELACGNEITDRMRKYLNYIRLNSNRQLRLVNNLLDIIRVNAGHMKVDIRKVDLVQLTKALVDSVLVVAEQKGIKLEFSASAESLVTAMDVCKYERILLNLLSNAVKFTPEGNWIYVDISTTQVNGESFVSLRVRDQGVGIPADKHELIFECFGQVESALTRHSEGTGVGLHLVKTFAEFLGGKVSLESEVGAGSTFTVLLPLIPYSDARADHQEAVSLDMRITQAAEIEFSAL